MKTTTSLAAALLLSVTAAHSQSANVYENAGPTAKPPSIAPGKAFAPVINKLAAPPTSMVLGDPTGSSKSAGVDGAPTGWATRAHGSFGVPYTATRVTLGPTRYTSAAGGNLLQTTYPYRAVGLLVFDTDDRHTWVCTATVIKRGVAVTAAHCIQEFGAGSTLFLNWGFAPGYYGGVGTSETLTATQRQPYGWWTYKSVVVPSTWSNGTDIGSGAARNNDIALIAFGPNSAGRFVGDYTGRIGYAWDNYGFVRSSWTGNLAVAAVTTIGYSAYLDDSNVMQRTDGPAYLATVGGALNYLQGSNFTDGSSGSPWIVNFNTGAPQLFAGAVPGVATRMAIVGVTSWMSSNTNMTKESHASRFGRNAAYPAADYGGYGAGNIGFLLYHLCTSKPAGSASTYGQLGYCS